MDSPVIVSQIHQSTENGLDFVSQRKKKEEKKVDALPLLVMKLGKTENSEEREEQEHRIQQNEARYTQPAHIYRPSRQHIHKSLNPKKLDVPRRTINATK